MGMLHGDFEVVDKAAASIASLNYERASSPKAEPPAGLTDGVSPGPPATGESSYVVVIGDSLGRIALKLYNKSARWPEIVAVNPGIDPRRLRPGQVIKLPEPLRP